MPSLEGFGFVMKIITQRVRRNQQPPNSHLQLDCRGSVPFRDCFGVPLIICTL